MISSLTDIKQFSGSLFVYEKSHRHRQKVIVIKHILVLLIPLLLIDLINKKKTAWSGQQFNIQWQELDTSSFSKQKTQKADIISHCLYFVKKNIFTVL